jgi:hypothetical protein
MSLTLMALLRATRRAVSGFAGSFRRPRQAAPAPSGVQSARSYASGWMVASCRRRNYFTGRIIYFDKYL